MNVVRISSIKKTGVKGGGSDCGAVVPQRRFRTLAECLNQLSYPMKKLIWHGLVRSIHSAQSTGLMEIGCGTAKVDGLDAAKLMSIFFSQTKQS